MTPFPYHGHPGGAPLNETIYANFDAIVSQWEDEGGSTTTNTMYQSVDSESDSDWVELRSANHIINSSTTRNLRFDMASPSGTPLSSQTVVLKVRCKWVDVFNDATPDSGHPRIELNLFENGSQVSGGAGSWQALSESAAEYTEPLSSAAIGNVSNWDDVELDMDFECTGLGLDQEVDFEVYRVRIVFSP
jgi:hypothetical protein